MKIKRKKQLGKPPNLIVGNEEVFLWIKKSRTEMRTTRRCWRSAEQGW